MNMANSRFDYHKKEEIALDRQFEPRFYVVIKLELDICSRVLTSLDVGRLSELVKDSAYQVMNRFRGHVRIVYCDLKSVHFIITPESDLFTRRISKLVSMISVIFATHYDNNLLNYIDTEKCQDSIGFYEIKRSDWFAKAYELGDLMQTYRYLVWAKDQSAEPLHGTVLEYLIEQNRLHEFNIELPLDKEFWLDFTMFHRLDRSCMQDSSEDLNTYFKAYELDNRLCYHKGCYIIIRIDGDKFHNYSTDHQFHKPNDKRALDLMSHAAKRVMDQFKGDVPLSYGASDEFSFLIRYNAETLTRDIPKMLSIFATKFSNYYNQNWNHFFGNQKNGKVTQQTCCALFDAKIRKYPDFLSVINYFKWRQADCHINNLFNTTLHVLTGFYQKHELTWTDQNTKNNMPTNGKGVIDHIHRTPIRDWIKDESQFLSPVDATNRLKGTFSADKQDILFKEFGVNYNKELEQFKKGTVIVDTNTSEPGKLDFENRYKCYFVDITKHNDFWIDNSHIFDDFDLSLLKR